AEHAARQRAADAPNDGAVGAGLGAEDGAGDGSRDGQQRIDLKKLVEVAGRNRLASDGEQVRAGEGPYRDRALEADEGHRLAEEAVDKTPRRRLLDERTEGHEQRGGARHEGPPHGLEPAVPGFSLVDSRRQDGAGG